MIQAASGKVPAELVLKNTTYVNVFSNELCSGDIALADGHIVGIGTYTGINEIDCSGKIVLPAFIDAHIHLESALVSPSEFIKAVLPHGTSAVITDPHEIANIMGIHGINYMLQATEGLPVDVYFMLPSCVPATPIDESGAVLDYRSIDPLYQHPRVLGLGEMMDFVGISNGDAAALEKIEAAHEKQKIVDGHAPDLLDCSLNAYIAAGIYSDHECHDLQDAIRKIQLGQAIMIREGTAAHNLEALVPLLNSQYSDRCMFCTDDKHPNDLLREGHIDGIIKRAISLGADPIIAVKAASYNAARYFSLKWHGAIAPGYWGDLVIIDNFHDFTVEQVFKYGAPVLEKNQVPDIASPRIDPQLEIRAHHTFHVATLSRDDFLHSGSRSIIGMIEGEITTANVGQSTEIDLQNDILKIAVIERHKGTGNIGIGFIKGYGLKSGAVATSVSHDSHNIIVVGTSEAEMAAAANRIVALNGGIVVWQGDHSVAEVPLAIAGIMSDEALSLVNAKLEAAKTQAHFLGVGQGVDPFMTLSFMALPVIPSLRITTRGIFDVTTQQYL